jgi:hypothetical protein
MKDIRSSAAFIGEKQRRDLNDLFVEANRCEKCA